MPREGHFDKDCLYSTIKNTSGVAKTFGFLPPHGVKLAVNEEYTVFGNILETVGQAGDRAAGRRERQALLDALDRGDVEIISTPAPIFKDAGTGLTKMLKLTNGTLSAVAPCWENSDSLDALAAA